MDTDRAWSSQKLHFTVLSIGLVLVAYVATAVARNIFVEAQQPIGWAIASLLVALLLSPAITRISRHVPRGLAIAVTMLLVLVLITTVGVTMYRDLRAQVDRLSDALPSAAANLEDDGSTGELARDLRLEERVQTFVDDLDERYSERAALEGAVGTLPAYFVNGILVVFFIVWGPRMHEGYLRQIGGEERRERHRRVIDAAVQRSQGYLLTVLGEGIVVGSGTGLLLWALEVPSPAILGLLVGAMSLVPYVGVLFGAVPALLLAAAFRPMQSTVLLAVVFVAIQVLTGLAQQRIHRLWMRPGPAVIVVAAMVGHSAYGPGGAFYGAVAAVIAVAFLDVASAERDDGGGRPGTDDSALTVEDGRG